MDNPAPKIKNPAGSPLLVILLIMLIWWAPSFAHASIDDVIYAPMELVPERWEHRDKWAHVMVGGFIYANVRMARGHRQAVVVALLAAITKEVYDLSQGRPFNPNDIAASMAVPLTATLVWKF